jgi:hypothetical protein
VGDGALAEMPEVTDVWEFAVRDVEERFFVCAPSAALKEKWLIAMSVGASFQERAAASVFCTMCGGVSDDRHVCKKGQTATEPVITVLQDVTTPDEVFQWLRADPERKKAQELAKKGPIERLAPSDRKQWESLQEKARSEKRETLRVNLHQIDLQSDTRSIAALISPHRGPTSPVLGARKVSVKEALEGDIWLIFFVLKQAQRAGRVFNLNNNNSNSSNSNSNINNNNNNNNNSSNNVTADQDEEDGEAFIVFSAAVSPRK